MVSAESPRVCWRGVQLLVSLFSLLAMVAMAKHMGFVWMQSQHRCIVLQLSQVLNHHKLPYWWDFGTLLGLAREKDLIFSEVDADLSVTTGTRAALDAPSVVNDLKAQHFVRFDQREGLKLRVFNSWGFYADVDTWDLNSSVSETGEAMAKMLTGRHDESVYRLPANYFTPQQRATFPKLNEPYCEANQFASGTEADQQVAVPNLVGSVLTYWYGEWQVPRKYDKGKDFSGDTFELFLWTSPVGVFVFESYWAGKVFARSLISGLEYHPWSLLKVASVMVFGLFLLSKRVHVLLHNFYLMSTWRATTVLLAGAIVVFLCVVVMHLRWGALGLLFTIGVTWAALYSLEHSQLSTRQHKRLESVV